LTVYPLSAKEFELDGLEDPNPLYIGAKAFNLYRMSRMGLPVPDGFVLSCNHRKELGSLYHSGLCERMETLATWVGRCWVASSDDFTRPLLVSVRSGAPVSMPGMLDTILNVGLTREKIPLLNEAYKASDRFGFDCYRRLIQMYGVSVESIDPKAFTEYADAAKTFFIDIGKSERACQRLVDIYEGVFERETGRGFPSEMEQITKAVDAVYDSWDSPAAVAYRESTGIDSGLGTAVIVQQMVFGNHDDSSGSGVVFTHNPNTGEKGMYGEFMIQGQGEDVVAGTHTTTPIAQLGNNNFTKPLKSLKIYLGRLFVEFSEILDIEFTIESGKLYLLQFRTAKRSRRASIRFAMDMMRDGVLSSEEATKRITDLFPSDSGLILNNENLEFAGFGVAVGGEAISAPIAIGPTAKTLADQKDPFIYVAENTDAADFPLLSAATGILTANGGALSHAAILARSWDKPCVVGFEDMKVFEDHILINQIKIPNGTIIQIDGSEGSVYVPTPT